MLNHKKASIPILLAFFCILFSSSCINSEKVHIGKIEKFSISKMGLGNIECTGAFEIINESIWPITLSGKEINVLVGNEVLGKVNFVEPLKIESHSKKIYSLKFSVEITNMELGVSSVMGSVFGKKSEYRLKGNVSACSLFLCKNIEINEVLEK